MSPFCIATIVGARPQFVKAAAVSAAITTQRDLLEEVLIHTGQHYDVQMSEVFFRDLPLREPERNLGVGSGTHARQTGAMLVALEVALSEVGPDMVMVYGDTNSTLAGALAAAKLDLPLAHVEAGLRSFRRDMPEEINRVVADRLSTLLFCPTETAVANLAQEGITDGVELVGDVMHDLVQAWMPAIDESSAALEGFGLKHQEYALATVHRAANTDNESRLRDIVEGLARVAEGGLPVVFPVHPRTREALRDSPMPVGMRLVDPLGYEDMLILERHARVILTDSGGVQKEAYWLGVPCVTLRDETEWPETLDGGWNVLAGSSPLAIAEAAVRDVPPAVMPPTFGTGNAAQRIVEVVVSSMSRVVRGGV